MRLLTVPLLGLVPPLLAALLALPAAAQTTAPAQPVAGLCGPANGVPASAAPAGGLCSMGAASPVSGNGPWSWRCGFAACSAPLAASSGICGSANGVAAAGAPVGGLCLSGTASLVSGAGPWTWTCAGSGGGASASCGTSSGAVNGACGTANGVTTASAPTTGLCNAGTASVVSGSGPWTWVCLGSGGGTSLPCGAGP